MPDFGFVGAAYQALSPTQDAQECINFYPEVDATDFAGSKATGVPPQRGVIALYPCPGLTQLCQLTPISQVRGGRVIPGGQTLYVVCGSNLYAVTLSFIATVVGTLNTTTGPVSITDNGVSLYLCDGPNRYFYTWGTNTFSVVSDGAFNGANHVDIVDNFIVYNNPNSNEFGCTNVGSVVSGLTNFATTLVGPGNLVGLICDHRQVFLFGERTSEVWIDVGSFPFPFAIIPGTSMQHGCAAIGSIARLGESFAMLVQDDRGQNIVITMSGYSPVRISTHAIEQAISKYSIVSDAVAFTYQQNGHEFYMLTFPTADITWCYDLATQLWHRRASMDSEGVLHRHRANCCFIFGGNVVVGDYANGKLYKFDLTNFTDNGTTILCKRRARHLTTDLKRQYFHDLQLQFQPGVGLSTGQGSNPQAILKWSDDGGFTWSNEHWTSIGQMGQYKNRAIWRRLGWARDRIFEVTITDPVFRTIISAELNASPGVN